MLMSTLSRSHHGQIVVWTSLTLHDREALLVTGIRSLHGYFREIYCQVWQNKPTPDYINVAHKLSLGSLKLKLYGNIAISAHILTTTSEFNVNCLQY